MQIVLIILDGWGLAQIWGGNAIGLAKTPTMDFLSEHYPFAVLEASGQAVGLPFDEPGNSEVGHLNIGSGQIVYQGLPAINQRIKDGSFFKNPALEEIMGRASKENKALHLIGLTSDGGIHSHISHLFALLELAKKHSLKQVFIHTITDGRDSAPTSGIKYIQKLGKKIQELGIGKIASVSGRYFAMDRDNHWDRIEKVYEVLTSDQKQEAESAEGVIYNSYAKGVTDEFILPVKVGRGANISDGDSVIFFNFRSDRARQLVRALTKKDFNEFKRPKLQKDLHIATFATYQEGLPVSVVFESKKIANPLANILTENKLTHLHIAETEKYPHVTYFFNGGIEKPFNGEQRILIPSPKVPTYDKKPEMSAREITEKALKQTEKFDFTVINFANTDMVGHTGNMKATIKAVETVDGCLGKLIQKILDKDITAIITADHGNAEQMINPLTGLEDTEHTTNPVPFILISQKNVAGKLSKNGRICDIAPTILKLLGLKKPESMSGESLLKNS